MGATLGVIKTLIVPALISLIIYLISTFILRPLWHRYRLRSNYQPIRPPFDAITSRTSTLRARIYDGVARYVWRRDRGIATGLEDDDEDGLSFDGEELGSLRDTGRGVTVGQGGDDVRRLSRDLEEGFMDDSDEENEARGRVV